jgi:hypothetical protein
MISAQQVNTQVGRVTTNFDYKDSNGDKLENLFSGNGFSYAVGYRMPLFERIFLNADVIYNTYSSFGSDELYGNSYSWKSEYLGMSAGVEGEVWKNRGYTLLIRGDLDPQLMTKGTQIINEQAYDLKGAEQFDKPFLFYRGGVGFNFCAETNLSISLKYMYGIGTPIGNSDDSETLKLNTSTISIGVLWSFRKCTYCYSKRYR